MQGATGLSAAECAFFQSNGYLILPALADQPTVREFRSLAKQDLAALQKPLEYEADVAYPGAPASRDAPGGETIRRLKDAYQRHESYADWARNKRLVRALSDLLEDTSIKLVLSHHNCVMTKHPDFSSATHWHQDVRYWNFDSPKLISAWLALGREEQANGGMQLIPGSHSMVFEPDQYDSELFLRQDLHENQRLINQAVLAELNPGDVLLFDARLFHAAGRNQTKELKFALVFTYHGASTNPVPNSGSTSKPEIELYAA